MPKYINDGSVRIDRYRKVKTFWDHVKEFLQGLFGLAIILMIIGFFAS